MDIEYVGRIKSALFWWRRFVLCNADRPWSCVAAIAAVLALGGSTISSAPKAGGKSEDEGSVLGGLGRMIDGR